MRIDTDVWFWYDHPGETMCWVLSISLHHRNQVIQRGPVHWNLSAKPTARQIRKAIKVAKRMCG